MHLCELLLTKETWTKFTSCKWSILQQMHPNSKLKLTSNGWKTNTNLLQKYFQYNQQQDYPNRRRLFSHPITAANQSHQESHSPLKIISKHEQFPKFVKSSNQRRLFPNLTNWGIPSPSTLKVDWTFDHSRTYTWWRWLKWQPWWCFWGWRWCTWWWWWWWGWWWFWTQGEGLP